MLGLAHKTSLDSSGFLDNQGSASARTAEYHSMDALSGKKRKKKNKKKKKINLTASQRRKQSTHFIHARYNAIQSIDHPNLTFLRRILTVYGLWRPNSQRRWLVYQIIFFCLLSLFTILQLVVLFGNFNSSYSDGDIEHLFCTKLINFPVAFSPSPAVVVPTLFINLLPLVAYISIFFYLNHHLTWNLKLPEQQVEIKLEKIEAHATNFKTNVRSRLSAANANVPNSTGNINDYPDGDDIIIDINEEDLDGVDHDDADADVNINGYDNYNYNHEHDNKDANEDEQQVSFDINVNVDRIGINNGGINEPFITSHSGRNKTSNKIETGPKNNKNNKSKTCNNKENDHSTSNNNNNNVNHNTENGSAESGMNLHYSSIARSDVTGRIASLRTRQRLGAQFPSYDALVHFGTLLNEIPILDKALKHELSINEALQSPGMLPNVSRFEFRKMFGKKLRKAGIFMIMFHVIYSTVVTITQTANFTCHTYAKNILYIITHILFDLWVWIQLAPLFLLCFIVYVISLIHKSQLEYLFYLIDFNETLTIYQFKSITREIHRTITQTTKKFELILTLNSIIPIMITVVILMINTNIYANSNDAGGEIFNTQKYGWLLLLLPLYFALALFQLYCCASVTSTCDEIIGRIYHRQSMSIDMDKYNDINDTKIARTYSDVFNTEFGNKKRNKKTLTSHSDMFYLVQYVKDLKMGWFTATFRVDFSFLVKIVYVLIGIGLWLLVAFLSYTT